MGDIILALLGAIVIAVPLGYYIAGVLSDAPRASDRVFAPVERVLYGALGVRADRGMTARGYALAFLASNLVLGIATFLVFRFQGALPFNPDGMQNLSWDLALHTTVSFLTNTNQQHYSGQAQLSFLSQTLAITNLQVLTPMMGLCIAAAVLRGLVGGRNAATAQEGEPRDLGNYWVDLVRLTVRLMIPGSLLLALLLASQGVPSAFEGAAKAVPLDAAATEVAEQVIPRGPVAPMVAAKQLGTNGGGWYGPNSTVALENPTPLTNLLETIAIIVIPMAIAFAAGPLTRRPKLGFWIFGTMGVLSIAMIAAAVSLELAPNAAMNGLGAVGPNMEGKEVRIGPEASALWATLTTQTSNGSVNAMHDSLNPLTGLVPLAGMLINAVWGGIGCGLVGFLVYALLAVFLAGLMIGRTPEVFGRKLETREVRLLSLPVVLQPLVVLGLTALALSMPAYTGNSNPGFHGFSQVFYEYASAYANNGSGFEGLGDATPFWNVTATLALLAGRYPVLVIPLIVAGLLAKKRVAPETAGTLRIETPTFAAATLFVMIGLTLLQFMPALVLGPVAEALSVAP